jgi:hypothetical protein
VRLTVTERSDGETLERVVMRASWPMATVNTDEWGGFNGLPAMGRSRATVCHADREWARDDDGDGVREVHVNTLEGLWTGLPNFLRAFRGGEQGVPVPVRGDFRVGRQRQAGDACVPVGDPRREVSHHLADMSQQL